VALSVVDRPEASSDAELVAACVAGDSAAQRRLCMREYDRVNAIIFRILGSTRDADDLVQETFIAMFRGLPKFRGDSKLSTWIYRIAINLCKNRSKYLRVRHAAQQDELEAVAETTALGQGRGANVAQIARPDEAMAGKQVEHIVQQAILQLEPSFRECLVLRDVEDLSYEEIGAITGLPEGTVKSRIHRARAQLKEIVERALGEKIP
jgi:RNA polymerase sigma-70 factor (ECF subfamily)